MIASEQRRSFMGLAGISLLGSLGLPAGTARAAEPNAAEELVARFCEAWATRKIDAPLQFLSADCVYRMTETTPPAIGHAAIAAQLGALVEATDTLTFEVLETHSIGQIVINHRIDTFASKVRPLVWEGIGVFFIRDGKIAEWSDYTIRMSR